MISIAASMPLRLPRLAWISSPCSTSRYPVWSSLVTCRVCDLLSMLNIWRIFSREKPSIVCFAVVIVFSMGAGAKLKNRSCPRPSQCPVQCRAQRLPHVLPFNRNAHALPLCADHVPVQGKTFYRLSSFNHPEKKKKIKEKAPWALLLPLPALLAMPRPEHFNFKIVYHCCLIKL